MANGTFGLDNELIIINSGVRKIFTPYRPINKIKHFFGRENEATKLISVINSPGQHILVYGDRGVGKTSLSKTTCRLILQKIQKGQLFEKCCDSEDSFESIVEGPLAYVGIDFSVTESIKTKKEGANAGIKIPFASTKIHTQKSENIKSKQNIKASSPSWVASQLKDVVGVFLIDEIDSLRFKKDKKKIAELIKILSDSGSNFKLVAVGIAKNGEELTAGHPSVERCLKEVILERMSNDDLKKIIINGMKELKLIPTAEVTKKIIDISAGLPHFTHLICLKCAEYSLINKKTHVDDNILNYALEEAVKDSEGILKRSYQSTLRTIKKPNEYRLLLLAASYCNTPEFRSSELKNKLNSMYNVQITSQSLSRRLSKLSKVVNQSDNSILIKPARGCFQFTDPRMPSFLKMVLNKKIK